SLVSLASLSLSFSLASASPTEAAAGDFLPFEPGFPAPRTSEGTTARNATNATSVPQISALQFISVLLGDETEFSVYGDTTQLNTIDANCNMCINLQRSETQ